MSSLQGRGGIFISYRREESAANAGRLYDRLSDRFGEGRVFMDVDSIAIGTDFTEAVIGAVSGCDILLALIGRDWLTITDSTGERRIDNPEDWVRLEIETARQRDIRVVPVLVDGAALPRAADLPPSLRALVRRQALALTHAGFRFEVTRLIAAVEDVLGEQRQQPAKAPPEPSLPPGPRSRVLQVGQWVYALAFSPDGTRLATGSRQRVRVWNVQTGAAIWESRTGGPVTDVRGAAFSPDGTRLATGSDGKTTRIWDAATGQGRLQIRYKGAVGAVAFSPDGTRLATGSDDKTARIWDAATAQELVQITRDSRVHVVAFSADGTRLATGTDKTAGIWDAVTGRQQLLQEINIGGLALLAAAFSPDGTRLATGVSFDAAVRIWDIGAG
jgi:hypothetical protein